LQCGQQRLAMRLFLDVHGPAPQQQPQQRQQDQHLQQHTQHHPERHSFKHANDYR
jgi:hypothetical protein